MPKEEKAELPPVIKLSYYKFDALVRLTDKSPGRAFEYHPET